MSYASPSPNQGSGVGGDFSSASSANAGSPASSGSGQGRDYYNARRGARRAVACKSCHNMKVKCTPADINNPGGTCTRCLNTGKPCEINLNQVRRRRKKAEILEERRKGALEASQQSQQSQQRHLLSPHNLQNQQQQHQQPQLQYHMPQILPDQNHNQNQNHIPVMQHQLLNVVPPGHIPQQNQITPNHISPNHMSPSHISPGHPSHITHLPPHPSHYPQPPLMHHGNMMDHRNSITGGSIPPPVPSFHNPMPAPNPPSNTNQSPRSNSNSNSNPHSNSHSNPNSNPHSNPQSNSNPDSNHESPDVDILREKIKALEEKVKKQDEELKQRQVSVSSRSFPGRRDSNERSSSSSSVRDPNYLSTHDLEREFNALCDLSSQLTELTSSLITISDRRMAQLSDDKKHNDCISQGIITMDEARDRLEIYRNTLYAKTSLVEVPEHMTVEQLQKEQPLLLNAVMAVSNLVYDNCDNTDKALSIDDFAVKAIMFDAVVVGIKSVEIVKALLILSLWYSSPEQYKNVRYHLLNTLTVGILHDLGRPTKVSTSDDGIPVTQTLDLDDEYCGLVLTLYFATVSICLLVKRSIYIKWTNYVEECCQQLEKSDSNRWKHIAMLGRLTHILDRIHHVLHTSDAGERGMSTNLYLTGEFHKALDAFRPKIDNDDHPTLAYYSSIQAYLYEPSLDNFMRHNVDPESIRLQEHSVRAVTKLTAACMESMDQFCRLSPADVARLPIFNVARVTYTAGVLLRLRFIVLSLPTKIERNLVPQHVLLAIYRTARLLDESSLHHKTNYFMKKTRLALQLLIQVYAIQLQNLILKSGEASNVFKRATKRKVNLMDKRVELFLPIEYDHKPFFSDNPADFTSTANEFLSRDKEGDELDSISEKIPSVHDATPQNSTPLPPFQVLSSTSSTKPRDPDGPESPTATSSNKPGPYSSAFISNPASSAPARFNTAFDTIPKPKTSPALNHAQTLPSISNIQGNQSPPKFASNLHQSGPLDSHTWPLNDDFWADLLNSESDRLALSNNGSNTLLNEEVFFN